MDIKHTNEFDNFLKEMESQNDIDKQMNNVKLLSK